MKKFIPLIGLVCSVAAMPLQAADVYGPYPVTVKGYNGNKTDSTRIKVNCF